MASLRNARGLLLGMMAVVAMHIAFVLIVTPIATHFFEPKNDVNYLRGIASFVFTLLSLGLSQLLYVVPFGLWLKKKRRKAVLDGVAIAALITILLSGGCFLSFVVQSL